MQTSMLDWLSAIGSILSGLGLFVAAVGLWYSARQAKAGQNSVTAAVFQNIMTLGSTINDTFIEQPELAARLFADEATHLSVRIEDEASADPQLFFAALKWLDYFETILILWPSIPVDRQDHWRTYITSVLARSLYLRRVVCETGWYHSDLRTLCGDRQSNQPVAAA